MSIAVERAGLLTTVQDLGRPGHQGDGVPEGGAMDAFALRVANLLVGNPPAAAALEATLDGPTLRFARATLVAVTGADLSAQVDGRPLPPWRSALVPAGGTLAFGAARAGCRAYVAVAGGIDVPPVLGSRATCLPATFGGHEGRALRRGDVLPVGAPAATAPRPSVAERSASAGARGVHWSALPPYGCGVVRLVAGPELARLDATSRAALFARELRVGAQSNRMGYRLEGAPLALAAPVELLSAGVAMGTVQLPPGGAPIVLMADRQTTGGYPRLGEVASVDLPVLAQLRPGDAVRFTELSLDEAQRLYLERERALDALARALAIPA